MIGSLGNQITAMVIVFALVQGGRYERLVGLALGARGVALILLMTVSSRDRTTAIGYDAIQAAYLAALIWLALRHRAPWLLLLTALQAVVVIRWWAVIDMVDLRPDRFHSFLITAAKAACLAWAVVWRWVASPSALPGAGHADVDLYEAAATRWPRLLPARDLTPRPGR